MFALIRTIGRSVARASAQVMARVLARVLAWVMAATALLAIGAPPALGQALPELALDPRATTVSGLSSGAYMAGQLHVVHSRSVTGAGVIAGGPYFCAEGSLSTALNRCMATTLGAPDAVALVERARALAGEGLVDPLTELTDDRVYLFSGTRDETVTRTVMDRARDFYRAAGVEEAGIAYVDDIGAGHGFVVEDGGIACGATGTPFINDCDYDQAGAILAHLYGPLAARGVADPDRLLAFDQAEFLADPPSHGMAMRGFVYVPEPCAAATSEAPCRLHVALAGCRQTPDDIGDRYARETGYNDWAESNRIVVLYPQSSASPGNPNGCWDWWGYDDPRYHTRRGRQIAAIAAMAAQLGVPFDGDDGTGGPPEGYCEAYQGSNWVHWRAGRVALCGWFSVCAVGTGDLAGWFYGASTLYESPEGTFSTTPCP